MGEGGTEVWGEREMKPLGKKKFLLAEHALRMLLILFSPRKERKLPTLPAKANLDCGSCGRASPAIRYSLYFIEGARPDKINGSKKMHTVLFQERHGLKRERNNHKGAVGVSALASFNDAESCPRRQVTGERHRGGAHHR